MIAGARYTLLTGASGFLGQHAGPILAEDGPVAGTFLTRPTVGRRVSSVAVDLSDALAVRRLFRDLRPEAVVHAAAMTDTGACERQPEEARAAIVLATQNILAARAEYTPDARLVGISTDLVFDGEAAPYAEDAAPKPLNRYGSLKWEAEQLILATPGAIVLRAALIFGPPADGRSSFLGWMVAQLAKQEPLTLFEDEWRTPVFVDDLARAIAVLLKAPNASGVYHAAGPDRISRLESGHLLADVFALPTLTIQPRFRADVPGGLLRARDVSLATGRLRSLGWSASPFRQALALCRDRWNSPP